MRDKYRLIDTIVTGSYAKIKSFRQKPLVGIAVVFAFVFVAGIVASVFLAFSSGLESASRAAGGNGLKGEYYNNIDFTNLKLTRTDPTINFGWGTGSPNSTLTKDTFSVRWTGFIAPLSSETYTFTFNTRDVFKLWIDSTLVASNNTELNKAKDFVGTANLTTNQFHTVKIEYQENTGSASAKLYWKSGKRSKQIIPQSQLYITAPGIVSPPEPPPLPSTPPAL